MEQSESFERIYPSPVTKGVKIKGCSRRVEVATDVSAGISGSDRSIRPRIIAMEIRFFKSISSLYHSGKNDKSFMKRNSEPKKGNLLKRQSEARAMGEDDAGTFTYIRKNYAKRMNMISERLQNKEYAM